MIFHIPFRTNPNHPSGTNIRPHKMLQGFIDLGYDVDFVMGAAQERSRQIKHFKEKVKDGVSYDFMYSESATLPTLLTEDHHIPTHPFLDFSLFKVCKQNNIPIGLFYRDVYWNFEDYKLSGIKARLTRWMYHYDLNQYRKYLHTLFLPSVKMAPFIPLKSTLPMYALPSGLEVQEEVNRALEDIITYFYVGGISDMYAMHELFKAFNLYPNAKLIVCTRKNEWEKEKHAYEDYLAPNIEIHHLQGKELQHLMQRAHVGLLFFRPNEYRNFAMPVKLFEYMSHNLAIISSNQTAVGEFTELNNLGWSIPYKTEELIKLLSKLDNHKDLLEKKRAHINKVKHEHNWMNRAKEVETILTNKSLNESNATRRL